MESQIAWWGGLYIVITLGFIYFAFTQQEENAEEAELWDFLYTIRDSLCYLSLLGVTALYFQPLNNPNMRFLYLSLSAYVTVTCIYYVIDYIKEYLRNPTGKLSSEEDEKEAGTIIIAISTSIPILFYTCGVVIALTRSQGLLS